MRILHLYYFRILKLINTARRHLSNIYVIQYHIYIPVISNLFYVNTD